MKIQFSKAIIKDVRKIKDQSLIDKIENTIRELKNANSIEDLSQIKKMKGHSSAYRKRIGDYRMGFYYEDDHIFLARLVKRNDIYKVFP